jgi:hypothetical protein
VNALKALTGDVTPEQESLRHREEEIRSLMASRRDSDAIRDPHVLLERVYANEAAYAFQAESPEEARQAKVLTKHWCTQTNGHSLAPGGLGGFQQRFDAFSFGAFKNFDWNNVFVAGGSVLACAQNPAMVDSEAFDNSDIDIFIVGIDDEAAATAKLRQIYTTVCANYGRDALVIRTLRAVTILGNYPQRHIQIILKLFKSPAEVLFSFDLDACSVGYDGTDVWAMERFRRAMSKRYNLVDHTRRSLSYESRLAKYSQRGFAVAVPTLHASRINPQKFIYVSPETLQGGAQAHRSRHSPAPRTAASPPSTRTSRAPRSRATTRSTLRAAVTQCTPPRARIAPPSSPTPSASRRRSISTCSSRRSTASRCPTLTGAASAAPRRRSPTIRTS